MAATCPAATSAGLSDKAAGLGCACRSARDSADPSRRPWKTRRVSQVAGYTATSTALRGQTSRERVAGEHFGDQAPFILARGQRGLRLAACRAAPIQVRRIRPDPAQGWPGQLSASPRGTQRLDLADSSEAEQPRCPPSP
jgi:hypothetical protein